MNNVVKRLLCTALCAALLLGCIGTASAAGKKKAYDPEISELFECWYYVTDTVPEGMRSGNNRYFSALWDQNYMEQESVVNCEVTFVSGEEQLKDAVYAEPGERSDGSKDYNLWIKSDALTVPGTAKFRITIETENYVWEEEDTLVVLDYNEYPLVEEKKSELSYEAQPGDVFLDYEVMDEAAVINVEDIAAKTGFKSRFDMLHHYMRMDRSYEDYDNNPDAESAVETKLEYGLLPDGNEYVTKATVRKYGVHHMTVSFSMGNIYYSVPFTIIAEGFAITTSDKAVPGAKVQFTAYGSEKDMTVTWSVDGEGAEIDPESGLLTIDENTPMGSNFVVRATNSEGGEATAEVVLNDGILDDVEFPTTRGDGGFNVPIPGGDWYNNEFDLFYGGGYVLSAVDYGGSNRTMDAKVYWTGTKENSEILLEDPELARAGLEAGLEQEGDAFQNVKTEWIEIDGHPASLQTFSYFSNGSFYANIGVLKYPRNTRELWLRVYSYPFEGQEQADVKPVSIGDLKKVASFITYSPDDAPFIASDAEITLTAQDDATAVSAGKTLQFKAAFANPERVNKKNKNDGLTWTVTDAATGEEVGGVSINAKGQLKVDKSLAAPVDIQVRATSAKYGNSAAINLSALPVAGQIAVEPAELFFYVGTDDAQTVRAILTPDTVPLTGITWTPAKAGIVEIEETGDGTVSVRPLAAGKTVIAVKEPGGKNAKLAVNVVDPVESVELTLKGNAKAGGTVSVNATLQPKTAGNKNLEWSLDVGEDVATIDTKGKVKISKEAASGTKITVTCKALGAPEPVVATIEIEIP